MKKFGSIFAALLILGSADAARACSVCFGGNPNDPMIVGAKAGIIFMLVLIYSLLFLMVGIGVSWWRRAKALAGAPAEDSDGRDAADGAPSPQPL